MAIKQPLTSGCSSQEWGWKREKYAAIKEQLEGKRLQVCYDGLLWARWEHGTPKMITTFARLGSVISMGPCSKSSAAVMPFL